MKSQRSVPVLGVLRVVIVDGGGADSKVARLTQAQRGLVSRSQLIAAGVSAQQIQVRQHRQQLRPIHRGVYSVNRGEPPELFGETAALLACGEHAALSHLTAIRMWRLLDLQDLDEVHVSVVRRCGRNRAGIRVHHSDTLTQRQVGRVAGLPTTRPERTLLDSAPLLTPVQLGRAFDEAIARRATSYAKVADLVLRHRGHPGRPLLAAVVDQRRAPTVTESEAEHRFLRLIAEAGLPAPRTQVQMHGFRVDAYWPQARFAVEIDGFQWHGLTRKAFERDRHKQQVLQGQGIEVARTTWNQITEQQLQLVAHVAQRLALRTAAATL